MIFAIELSSHRGGIALLKDDVLVAKRDWEDPSARHAALWPSMESLIEETRLDWSQIVFFAVGRGPGSYSGLRAALTAARMLATPGGQPVIAVSSGAALAYAWFSTHANEAGELVIAGDARRDCIWHGTFVRKDDGVAQRGDWTLSPASEFLARFGHSRVASIDAARLHVALGLPPNAGFSFDATPSAEAVGRLAWMRVRSDIPSEALEPLYLHPPV